MDKFEYLAGRLDELKEKSLFRDLKCIRSPQGPIVRFADGTEKILFCSNNYLGLADDQQVKEAVVTSLNKYGYGSASSRLISGTTQAHLELEKIFAEFLEKESALMFSSGWCANQAILTTLPGKGDLVLMDRLDHASIIDGARQSDAEFRTYRGDGLGRVVKYLKSDSYNRKFIVTESVFSMDGVCADIEKLVELKNKYNAVLIVDEAHSIGCMGDKGAGLCEKLGFLEDIDIIVAPLGKAFAANGAMVCGPKVVTEYLVNTARSFIYTTSPVPSNCAAVAAGLDIIKKCPHRREALMQNAEYLRRQLTDAGLDTLGSRTHIVPVLIGQSDKAADISRRLYDRGFYVAAIRPPTVAKGSARLRLSVQYGHTKEQIDALVEAIVQASRMADNK